MTVQQLTAMLTGLEERSLVVRLEDGEKAVNGIEISHNGNVCIITEK